MGKRVQQINNLVIEVDDKGFYSAKNSRGEVIFRAKQLDEIQYKCKMCKDYIEKVGIKLKRTEKPMYAVLCGESQTCMTMVLCKSEKEAKNFMKVDVQEKVRSGEVLLEYKNAADVYNRLESVIVGVNYVTRAENGILHWWRIVTEDEIKSIK